jgi:hypothetical protein
MTVGGVDFFVSSTSAASADRPWAEWIAWELEHRERRPVPVWVRECAPNGLLGSVVYVVDRRPRDSPVRLRVHLEVG